MIFLTDIFVYSLITIPSLLRQNFLRFLKKLVIIFLKLVFVTENIQNIQQLRCECLLKKQKSF